MIEGSSAPSESTLSFQNDAHGFSGCPAYYSNTENTVALKMALPQSASTHSNKADDVDACAESAPLNKALSERTTPLNAHDHISDSINNHPDNDHAGSLSTVGAGRPISSLDSRIRPYSTPGETVDKPWIENLGELENFDKMATPLPSQTQLQEHSNTENPRAGPDNHAKSKQMEYERDLEKGDSQASSEQSSTNGKPKKEETQKEDPNLIEFDGPNDPEHPQNYATWYKWLITSVYGTLTFAVTFASSIFSAATMTTSKEFGVSEEVMSLGTSLFVLGFAWGPTVWGPLSELVSWFTNLDAILLFADY